MSDQNQITIGYNQRWLITPRSDRPYPLVEVIIMEVYPSKQFMKCLINSGREINQVQVLTIASYAFIEQLPYQLQSVQPEQTEQPLPTDQTDNDSEGLRSKQG